MQQSIKVREKSVYGNVLVYPVCEKALLFAKLVNRKTFTHADLCIIEALGYTIECEKIPA